MSPEMEANDYVPLEFLLGARAKYYFPGNSPSRIPGRFNNANPKKIFTSTIHPRKREEQARHLLRRALDQDTPNEIDEPTTSAISTVKTDKAAVLRVLAEAASSSLNQDIFYHNSLQLNVGSDCQAPEPPNAPRKILCHELEHEERVNSFHGYDQSSNHFLGVAGAAARIPHTTTRQLRDLKLNAMKAKKALEDKRTHEMTGVLHQQQTYTRKALRSHQQLIADMTKTPQQPRTVAPKLLGLESVSLNENPGECNVVSHGRKLSEIDFQEADVNYLNLIGISTPRRLATIQLDGRTLFDSGEVDPAESILSTSVYTEEDTLDSEEHDDSEKTWQRLRDRQRQVFTSITGKGLSFGGGYVAKKTNTNSEEPNNLPQAEHERKFLNMLGEQSAVILPLPETNKPDSEKSLQRFRGHQHKEYVTNTHHGLSFGGGYIAKKISTKAEKSNNRPQVEHEREFLETLLDAQSAVIIPLEEANKPALRRRNVSARQRQPRTRLKSPPEEK